MRRRDFIAFLASVSAAWPARGQQGSRKLRIGVLVGLLEGDPQTAKYLKAFQEALGALGWKDGKNLQIDFRAAIDLEVMRSRASELISLGPDVVLTYSTPATNESIS
jgi:hypothetical protein